MTLAVPDDGFLAAPDDAHRALEFPGGQRQHDLHGHIFTSAEGAADGRVDHAHVFIRQAECMCDLLAVGMCPLAASFDGHMPILIHIGQAGLRLQVSMFLHWCTVFVFNDHIRLCKSGFDVAFADLVMHADVGIVNLLVHTRSTGLAWRLPGR